MTKRKRRAFTPEFKADAVRLVKASERGIRQVAKELDLTETALRDWVKRDAIDAGKGPPDALTTAERISRGRPIAGRTAFVGDAPRASFEGFRRPRSRRRPALRYGGRTPGRPFA